MKNLFCIGLLVSLFACKEQAPGGKRLQLDGVVKNTSAQIVYLEELVPDGRPVILDSAKVAGNGSFQLKAKSKEESIKGTGRQWREEAKADEVFGRFAESISAFAKSTRHPGLDLCIRVFKSLKSKKSTSISC